MKRIGGKILSFIFTFAAAAAVSPVCGQNKSIDDAKRGDLTFVYDGREKTSPEKKIDEKISDDEKTLVENEIRLKAQSIRKRGESYEIKCDRDDFKLVNAAVGSFTKPKTVQKAFLYQLCAQGEGETAVFLSGIVIIENKRPVEHQVFGNIKDEIKKYDRFKALPDFTGSGLSKIVLEYSSGAAADLQKRAQTIEIYELIDGYNALKLATLDVSKDDAAYKIYVKAGENPIFYRETYEKKADAGDWQLKTARQTIAAGESVYPRYFRTFSVYQAGRWRLTAEDITNRVIKLVTSLNSVKDISPENIERVTNLKPTFGEKRTDYGVSGHVDGTLWWAFGLSAYEYPGAKKGTDTLSFAFHYQNFDESGNPPLAEICGVEFETFSKELRQAGFLIEPWRGEHDRLLGWNFSRGLVSVQVSTTGKSAKEADRECVEMLVVSFRQVIFSR